MLPWGRVGLHLVGGFLSGQWAWLGCGCPEALQFRCFTVSGVILGTQGLGQRSFGGDAEPLWGLRVEEESLGTSSVSPIVSTIWLCFPVLKQSHKALPLPTHAGITSVHQHFDFTLSEYGCALWVCTQESRYPRSPDKGVRCPRAGVTGSCELLCVDAGDLTPFRSSAHF